LSGNDNMMTVIQNLTEYQPTEKESQLLEVLLTPEHRMKSITDICKLACCSRVIYYEAFKKPGFQALYKAQSRALVDQSVAPVLNTFVREALRGSFQHGKVILEMAGLYSEKSQVDVNMDFNINLTVDERRSRIAQLLGTKQLDTAIPVDFAAVEDKEKEPFSSD